MSQSHPLVVAYLERLRTLLDAASPTTRAEIVAGVREHLQTGLPSDARPDQVRAALLELGPPEQIADEAFAAEPGSPSVPPTPGWAERRWLPVVVMGLSLAWLVVPAAIAVGGASQSAFALNPVEMFFLLIIFPVWPVVALLVGISRLWGPREKLTLIAALPALAVWVLLISSLPHLLSATATLVGVVVTAVLVWRTGRRGVARAR